MKKRKLVAVVAATVLALSMAACNTAKGVKDDVENGVDKVEDGVDDLTDGVDDNNGDRVNADNIDVTLTVEAKDIIGSEFENKFEKDSIADEGEILSRTNYTVKEGTSVSQLLSKAMDENKIPYTMKGADQTAELSGIRGITGGMAGENSIWAFDINGSEETGSMHSYKLKDGDDVRVYYRLDALNENDALPDANGTTGVTTAK